MRDGGEGELLLSELRQRLLIVQRLQMDQHIVVRQLALQTDLGVVFSLLVGVPRNRMPIRDHLRQLCEGRQVIHLRAERQACTDGFAGGQHKTSIHVDREVVIDAVEVFGPAPVAVNRVVFGLHCVPQTVLGLDEQLYVRDDLGVVFREVDGEIKIMISRSVAVFVGGLGRIEHIEHHLVFLMLLGVDIVHGDVGHLHAVPIVGHVACLGLHDSPFGRGDLGIDLMLGEVIRCVQFDRCLPLAVGGGVSDTGSALVVIDEHMGAWHGASADRYLSAGAHLGHVDRQCLRLEHSGSERLAMGCSVQVKLHKSVHDVFAFLNRESAETHLPAVRRHFDGQLPSGDRIRRHRRADHDRVVHKPTFLGQFHHHPYVGCRLVLRFEADVAGQGDIIAHYDHMLIDAEGGGGAGVVEFRFVQYGNGGESRRTRHTALYGDALPDVVCIELHPRLGQLRQRLQLVQRRIGSHDNERISAVRQGAEHSFFGMKILFLNELAVAVVEHRHGRFVSRSAVLDLDAAELDEGQGDGCRSTVFAHRAYRRSGIADAAFADSSHAHPVAGGQTLSQHQTVVVFLEILYRAVLRDIIQGIAQIAFAVQRGERRQGHIDIGSLQAAECYLAVRGHGFVGKGAPLVVVRRNGHLVR